MSLSRSVRTSAAVLLAVLSFSAGCYASTLPWAPGVDFDIIGFFWLIENIPQLFLWTLAFALLFGAVVMALRAWWDV